MRIDGTRFGRLLALSEDLERSTPRHRKWLCVCDCGKQKTIDVSSLRSGATQSCGCLHREAASLAARKHGMAGTATHISWSSMIARCERVSNNRYAQYGARGISVCPRWREDFANFFADMGVRPPGTSLDRIDVNGDYEPGNCRWATAAEQAANKRNTLRVEIDGETRRLMDWAGGRRLVYKRAHARLMLGMRPAKEWFEEAR